MQIVQKNSGFCSWNGGVFSIIMKMIINFIEIKITSANFVGLDKEVDSADGSWMVD